MCVMGEVAGGEVPPVPLSALLISKFPPPAWLVVRG